MTVIERPLALSLAAAANRAPSAHNTQPARWRFTPGGEVLLFEDTSRRLAVGDPTGRDHGIGLGAAVEGLRLALSGLGLALGDPDPARAGDEATVRGRPELRLVARARLSPGARPDPLASWVAHRRTYRGRFAARHAAGLITLQDALSRSSDVHAIFDAKRIATLAVEADRATARLSERPGAEAELYHWLRFSPRDRAWRRDGLTAACLGLSAPERLAGRWLLEPRLFALLARAGVHRALLAEAPRTRTAWALVLLLRPRGEDPLETGRRFYRSWLRLTAAGFSARPISALIDDPAAEACLRANGGVPADSGPAAVFAVGRGRPSRRAQSPRLPPDELLV